jgi:hypothetical protein
LRDPGLNIFPVVSVPEGFELSREEETEVLNSEVERLREKAIDLQKIKAAKLFYESSRSGGTWAQFTFEPRKKVPVGPHNKSWRTMLKKRRPGEEKVLKCLAERYIQKKKQALAEEEVETTSTAGNWDLFHDISLYPNGIEYIIDTVRAGKPKISSGAKPLTAAYPDWDLSGHKETRVTKVDCLPQAVDWNVKFLSSREVQEVYAALIKHKGEMSS